MTGNAAIIVRVTMRESPEFWYATSPDLPGLHVCGETHEQVCGAIVKGVKALFKHNRKMDVEVLPITSSDDFPKISGPVQEFAVHRAYS
jgi:hypothetical protein